MAHYKLIYFVGIYGKAELIRMLFVLADVEFDDVKLEDPEWYALKPSTLFGQLPLLEFEGHTMCQSMAIARFLARRFGLAGKTEMDQVRADMIMGCFEDMKNPVRDVYWAGSEEKKVKKRKEPRALQPVFSYWTTDWFDSDVTMFQAEMKKRAVEETLPVMLKNMEDLLCQNNGGDGYFVGDEVTWADLGLVEYCIRLTRLGTDILDRTPKLKALHDKILNIPSIAAYVAKRPPADM